MCLDGIRAVDFLETRPVRARTRVTGFNHGHPLGLQCRLLCLVLWIHRRTCLWSHSESSLLTPPGFRLQEINAASLGLCGCSGGTTSRCRRGQVADTLSSFLRKHLHSGRGLPARADIWMLAGGTNAAWLWAVDPRFTMAAPNCFGMAG